MTKQDVVKVMTGQIHIMQFFAIYCIDLGHAPERVTPLVDALQHTPNVDFVNKLMEYTVTKAKNRFEIVVLSDPKKPNYLQIL